MIGTARRHLLQDRLRDRCDLSLGGADVDGRLEIDFDDACARQRLRFDMLDVVDRRRKHALINGDNAPRHVVRRQAGIAPDDRDDGNADVRKDVGRRPERRKRAENHDENRHDDEGIGARKRYPNDSCHPSQPWV